MKANPAFQSVAGTFLCSLAWSAVRLPRRMRQMRLFWRPPRLTKGTISQSTVQGCAKALPPGACLRATGAGARPRMLYPEGVICTTARSQRALLAGQETGDLHE